MQPTIATPRPVLRQLSRIAFRRSPLPFGNRCRLLGLVLAGVSAGPALAGWNAAPEAIKQHPTWIHTPSAAMPNGMHPLLVALHGCAQTRTELKGFGNVSPTVEANGVVVAMPYVGAEFFGTPQQRC